MQLQIKISDHSNRLDGIALDYRYRYTITDTYFLIGETTMQYEIKTGLSRVPLDVLKKRRQSLILERKAMYLRLRSAKRKIAKRRFMARIKTLNFRLSRLLEEIRSRPQNVRQGAVVSVNKSRSNSSLFRNFLPSTSSSFQPSIALPVIPVPLPESVMPKGYEYVEQMPSFVAEDPELEMMEEEIIVNEPTGFDLMLFVEDNKFLIGGTVLVGLFLALRSKPKKRSNPKRKNRKRKSVRKVRKNKRRSGYHRQ